ncbi:hypothetical protein Adt_05687 [Abeliophyllum distichum]|uniref:Uncharacterized protein n=1 Tax=Abeliophyllum distichum TaxID=126358 RepID=A0ABD1V4S4_9LAMI
MFFFSSLHSVEKCFVLKDLIVRLDKKNKKLETGENPFTSCSMVLFGSFNPILISNKGQTFSPTFDAENSLFEVTEFGPQLSKGAVLVELKVDREVNIMYVYLEMVKPDRIMTDDLDIWNSGFESEDEISNGWVYFHK